MPPLTDELGAYYERLSVAVRPLLRCRNAKRCAALVREEWSPVVATGAPARRLVALAVQRPEIIGPPPDRSSPVATALGEGRVMISGGSHVPYGLGYAEHAAELQVYDSATGSFEALGRLSIPPVDHTATLLPKGRVLIVGGSDDFLNRQMEAFVWDPTDGSTTYAGTLYHSRVGHTATPLPDGRVLILGGEDGWDQSAGETWSPLVQEFEPSPGLDEFRAFHSATLLPDGLVLVVGGAGTGEDGPDALASARLIDPVSGEVTEAGTLAAPRFSHTAVLADDGGVLIIGGTTLDDGTYGLGTTVERWDPEERSFSTVGELLHPRRGSTITPLSDGRVVIAGGTIETPDGFEVTDSVEVWDPESYTSSEATPLRDSRNDHAAVLLEDDAVLLVGGLEDPARSLSDAEVWRG
jgi:hypothetical protein